MANDGKLDAKEIIEINDLLADFNQEPLSAPLVVPIVVPEKAARPTKKVKL